MGIAVSYTHLDVYKRQHLDHGTYEGAKACIEAGFTSIMFDGSHYPIEENIAKTRELVEPVSYTHLCGLSTAPAAAARHLRCQNAR